MKIVFVGAGSTVFLKNVVGDLFLTPGVPRRCTIALYDIDATRLEDSRLVAQALNRRYNAEQAQIAAYLGVEQRRDALRDADIVIITIQVGGYRPATVADFEIPRRYGLLHTIGDTLGIGGIFRGLRTIPVVLDIAEELASVAPRALVLNYTNPMAIVTGALIHAWPNRSVGLCHSVQVCAPHLLRDLELEAQDLRWSVAGINHMAWRLEIRDGAHDLYPEIKRRAALKNAAAFEDPARRHPDMVRYELMRLFGYYVTESSEHNAEYTPYWIKRTHPELVDRFNIPLDEYPRRCEAQIAAWNGQRAALVAGDALEHSRSEEYAARIVAAVAQDEPVRIHANVRNNGSIANLPAEAVVEVATLVDGNGFNPTVVGSLPVQCAALNQTNINVQSLTLTAALQRSREHVYHAALVDPHTASELSADESVSLCDELFEAHASWLPRYR